MKILKLSYTKPTEISEPSNRKEGNNEKKEGKKQVTSAACHRRVASAVTGSNARAAVEQCVKPRYFPALPVLPTCGRGEERLKAPKREM